MAGDVPAGVVAEMREEGLDAFFSFGIVVKEFHPIVFLGYGGITFELDGFEWPLALMNSHLDKKIIAGKENGQRQGGDGKSALRRF